MKCFKIMIDDLKPAHPLYKYVDDSTISEIIEKSTSKSSIQETVNETVEWTKRNDMRINATKTHEMTINFQRDRPSFPPIEIDGTPIKQVTTAKLV